MAESFSHVCVCGALRQAVKVEPLPSGAQCGQFELLLREQSAAGDWYTTIVGCTLYGRHVEAARSLRPGQACVFTGKLARRKTRDGYVLGVTGFALEPLELPAPLPSMAHASTAGRN